MSADSNRSILAIQAETAWGVTPSPVNLQRMRITGENLIHEKMTTVSAEVRDDRQIADLVEVGQQASGGINFELSYEAWKPLIIAALMATPAVVNISDTFALNHTTQVVTGSAGDFDDVAVGSLIKIAGAANVANNGIKVVTAKANDGSTITLAAGSITVTEASPTLTITGTHAANGTARTSYLVERRIIRDDNEDFFQSYAGMMPDKLDLNIASRAIVTGSLSFLGKVGSAGSDTTMNDGGADYAAAGEGEVLNATSNVGTFAFDGVEAEEYLKSLTISLANGLRGKDAIGEIGNFAVGTGTCSVTGNINAYFRSNALLEKFRQHQDVSLRLIMEDAAGNTIGIYMPRVKLSSGTPAIGGQNQDVMIDAAYQAIRDPDLGITIAFDFIAA
jgi:hypothetical protein